MSRMSRIRPVRAPPNQLKYPTLLQKQSGEDNTRSINVEDIVQGRRAVKPNSIGESTNKQIVRHNGEHIPKAFKLTRSKDSA